MRYLADLHISPLTIQGLRAKGFEIFRVTEFLPPTATDREIIDLARRQGAVLITADLDFSASLTTYPSEPASGAMWAVWIVAWPSVSRGSLW